MIRYVCIPGLNGQEETREYDVPDDAGICYQLGAECPAGCTLDDEPAHITLIDRMIARYRCSALVEHEAPAGRVHWMTSDHRLKVGWA